MAKTQIIPSANEDIELVNDGNANDTVSEE